MMWWFLLWLAMMGEAMAQQVPDFTAGGTLEAHPGPLPGKPSFTAGTLTAPYEAVSPARRFPAQDGWLTFGAAGVSLGPNGEVRTDGKHDLDSTARQFWNAVARVRGQAEPFPEAKP